MHLHGVFVVVESLGVLLRGAAGSGKSELALELIQRGHALVADDAPAFHLDQDGQVIGHCPALLRDFLEIRGLGVLNIRRLFGDAAIVDEHRLDFIITLVGDATTATDPEQRHLAGCMATERILGRTIPGLTLAIPPGRHPATLVETSIRNHLLQRNGYNSAQDFQARLRRQLVTGGRRGSREEE